MQHMDRNLHLEFHIGELARMCAMSERTFMRKFKQRTAMTPVDWLSTARVDRVRELLERSEEHTSELQSLMRISYAVFCLKNKTTIEANNTSDPAMNEL